MLTSFRSPLRSIVTFSSTDHLRRTLWIAPFTTLAFLYRL